VVMLAHTASQRGPTRIQHDLKWRFNFQELSS